MTTFAELETEEQVDAFVSSMSLNKKDSSQPQPNEDLSTQDIYLRFHPNMFIDRCLETTDCC